MAKMGRPKSDNPKANSVTIRFDQAEYERFKAYAEKLGISYTEVIKRSLDSLYSSDESVKSSSE